jgi:hypothetical protein
MGIAGTVAERGGHWQYACCIGEVLHPSTRCHKLFVLRLSVWVVDTGLQHSEHLPELAEASDTRGNDAFARLLLPTPVACTESGHASWVIGLCCVVQVLWWLCWTVLV